MCIVNRVPTPYSNTNKILDLANLKSNLLLKGEGHTVTPKTHFKIPKDILFFRFLVKVSEYFLLKT